MSLQRFPGSPFLRLAYVAIVCATITTSASVDAGFHDGGVAACAGCHVTHASVDGVEVVAGDGLLQAETATDTCLLCHDGGPSSVLGPSVFAPSRELGAGDFVFLYEDDLDDAVTGRRVAVLAGYTAGHDLVAPGRGLAADPRHVTAPGGSFPSDRMGCTSCHDPHGNTNYRMLHGPGPVQEGLFIFTYPAPEAAGLAVDTFGPDEGPSSHTAYRGGWSSWCANCHGFDVHGPFSRFPHPVDLPLGSDVASRYADYAGDAAPSAGDPAVAYLAEVPFVDLSSSTASTAGPGASSRIECITCHRAHASSAPHAGRWDFRVETLGDDGAQSGSYPLPNPYADPAQRQLCVKCHDTGGHDRGRSCHQCHGSGRGGPDEDPPEWTVD